MRVRMYLAAAVLAAIGLAQPAQARPVVGPPSWTPENTAEQIERSAETTSFKQLEVFGREAQHRTGRNRLDRLNHVAWLFLNQSEFVKFDYWNGLLKAQAARDHDARYRNVAEINDLRSRYDRGDSAAGEEIKRRAEAPQDWFARAHAKATAAYVLITQNEVGSALRILYPADDEIPIGDRWAGMAHADVWESLGLGLMSLHDLGGAADAFGRQQFEFAPADYPRPDFDGVYNMAQLAAELGQKDLAGRLVAAHHRLAVRSDLKGLGVWDAYLCAYAAEARRDSAGVTTCLAPLGEALSGAAFLAPKILPVRAIARARLGQAAGAARDLAALRKLHASKTFGEAKFVRLPQVAAEVMRAQGHDRAAFDQLSRYADDQNIARSQGYSAGISQLTQEMQKQLGARREQLVTADRNAALQRQVIKVQYLAGIVGVILVIAVLALLAWQARAAGALRRARRNAEAANRAKSEFLANMSHEIRTPLNGVVGVADMLARANLGPKEREMVEIIRSSGDTLQRLLSDVLDLARVESGKITIETAPFHLGDMVRGVAMLSQLRCDEKGVGLVVHVAPELDRAVSGDVVRVRQVVGNFISNAVKFTEQGAITLTVETTPAGLVRFTVSDTGVGFDPANKAKVMGRFQQADNTITRRYGGTGLGLAISAELAQLMGGSVDCDAVLGEGARFWMELPLPPADMDAVVDADDAADVGDQRLRILAADDHPTNRRVLELMLGEVADLVSVENGREAVDAVIAGPAFDLVLMDMQMPVMDGLTAVREIRRAEQAAGGKTRMPIIMLTANAMSEHVSEALAAGANLHLGKPFTADALFEAIGEAMAAGEAGQEEAA
jgi:signal transduction histidine kinase/ActR/RegA family two-component response regulator